MELKCFRQGKAIWSSTQLGLSWMKGRFQAWKRQKKAQKTGWKMVWHLRRKTNWQNLK